jgi:hypothetical protein
VFEFGEIRLLTPAATAKINIEIASTSHSIREADRFSFGLHEPAVFQPSLEQERGHESQANLQHGD